MRKSLNWFLNNGCELQNPDPLMLTMIYSESRGNPCDGCGCKDTCPAWPLINQPEELVTKPVRNDPPKETTAQIAERLGISKNEVRRRRRVGAF